MSIRRTYGCNSCGKFLQVTLELKDYDAPPPECPHCSAVTEQEFQPIAIGGSDRSKAVKIAEDIMAKDYGVADAKVEGKQGGTPTVRYKDQSQNGSFWGIAQDTMAAALTAGRASRLKHGNGLDVLHSNIKNGVEPDLIALSKRKSLRVY
jgi:DNA-directed RNA polymerase subunit RPC12/RpoP